MAPFAPPGIPGLRTTGQTRFDMASDFHFNPHILSNLDDRSTMFFRRQLEHIIPEMFNFEDAPVSSRSLFPIDRSAGPVANAITWRQRTGTGQAKIVADYSDDIQYVSANGEEFTTPIRGIMVGAKWSIQEIRAAQATGTQLERGYAMDAREAMLQEENRIMFAGSAAYGVQGLASAGTGISQQSVPNGSWLALSTTGAQILQDLYFLANVVPEGTKNRERAGTMALPLEQYNHISQLKAGTATDDTVLTVFLKNNAFVKEVVPIHEMSDAFGNPAAFVYQRNPSKLRMQIPLDIEQLAPQQVNMEIHVLYHMRIGGLTVFKPAGMVIGTGI